MHTLTATTTILAHSLAWALLSSLWQGLFIYGLLLLLLNTLPNISARIKYSLSAGAFSVLFLWFADTWFTQYDKLKGLTVYITQAAADGGNSTTYAVKALAGSNAHNVIPAQYLRQLEQYFPLFIVLYTLGLMLMLCRFLVSIWQLRMVKTRGLVQPDEQWSNLLLQLQKQLGILRPVQLFLSNRINVPMMLGAIKPIILLPVATINHLSMDQLETILLHELAHIKRHDYLLNIFQTAAETILFFNPFVWLLSAIIRKEREHCCDDLVVALSASPLPYAHALAILENNRLNQNSLIMAATGPQNHLLNRIKRIMEMKKTNVNNSRLTIILVAIIAATITIGMFAITPSFAQKATGEKNDSTRKNVYHYKTVTIDANGRKKVEEKVSDKPIDEDDESTDMDIHENDMGKSKHVTSINARIDLDSTGISRMIQDITNASKDLGDVIKKIDAREIERNIEKAEKQIDAIDWDAISTEINSAIAEVHKNISDPKLRKEIRIEINNAIAESKKDVEQSKRDIAQSKKEVLESQKDMELNEKGHHGISQSTDVDEMIEKMKSDGLIEAGENTKIEVRNDNLYINGKKQSTALFDKYCHTMRGRKVTINWQQNEQ